MGRETVKDSWRKAGLFLRWQSRQAGLTSVGHSGRKPDPAHLEPQRQIQSETVCRLDLASHVGDR